ncbi:SDR family NAD(P)-dependent oxidoreductase [Lentilactobacillus rapi]|uniref:SDR family NAD(P)-dependent oxidoreductase n=1 Tax=Lentilactobacillus rapi TaxID=481723 RepID=UPI001FB344C3|nr:SDR family NAD(P)-dependent oxidoreductase [Lentilactobacillus rapi]
MSKEIAIVTGGASGIGLAISKELMNKDIQVVAADINEDALNEAKKSERTV